LPREADTALRECSCTLRHGQVQDMTHDSSSLGTLLPHAFADFFAE
jgi:hypothetical protein